MQVNQKCVIKGAGFFVGEVEGTQHDTGQLFIEEPFDPSKPTYFGFRTVEYKCLNSDIPKSVKHLQFPISAEVTMEISASKRGQTIVVTAIKPIEPVKAQPR
jgi:hypothetical protein